MKKKIISFIGLALFVGAVAFNVHMTKSSSQANEVMLENIEALASTGGNIPQCCENIWTVTWSMGTDLYCKCTTGGNYACPICCFN